MNGLIGNADSAKFIFVSVEDESQLPSKGMMKEYFPNHQMNVYKAWGYFGNSFESIEGYINIKYDGIDCYARWNSTKNRCISHAIRLNSECPSNSFFALQYSHLVVAYYHLSHALMDELSDLLKVIGETNSLINSVVSSKDCLAKGIDMVSKHQLPDLKMSDPSMQSISQLFDSYGDGARQELSRRLNDWHSRAIWT
jgi:hypothetical protein